jgi:hypothetical protein
VRDPLDQPPARRLGVAPGLEPAIMSRRIASETASRVVERPRALALSTSAALACAIRAQTPSSASRPQRFEEGGDRGVVHRAHPRERRRRPPDCGARHRMSAAGTCNRSPVSCTTTSRSPGENAAASSGLT